MGNKNNETEIGGYITATDRNSRYKGGIVLKGYLPWLYYENHNEFVLAVDPFRCLFEIHADGAYISHTFPEETWVRILEETPQTGRIESINENVQIIDSLVNFVGKSVNIIITFWVTSNIDAGNDSMVCYDILFLSFNIVKDKLIFQTNGTFTWKEILNIDTYRWYFNYISDL
jgi:hypothetical protein